MPNSNKKEETNTVESKEITKSKGKSTKTRTKKDTTIKEVAKTLDLETVTIKKVVKKPLCFNQNKSVADKIQALAEKNGVKTSLVVDDMFGKLFDLETRTCAIDIEEKGEEKVPNTYRINGDVLELIKELAEEHNMPINEYLNKVIAKAYGLK